MNILNGSVVAEYIDKISVLDWYFLNLNTEHLFYIDVVWQYIDEIFDLIDKILFKHKTVMFHAALLYVGKDLTHVL